MVSQEDMARGYAAGIRDQIERTRAQLAALEQHLAECEESLPQEEVPEPTDG